MLTYCTNSEWLNPQATAFYEAMEKLGATGRELANIFQAGDPFDSFKLYFKRAIEPG